MPSPWASMAPVAGAPSAFLVSVTLNVMLAFSATAGVAVNLTWYLQSSSSPSALNNVSAISGAPPSPGCEALHDSGFTTIGVTLLQWVSAAPVTGPPAATAPSLLSLLPDDELQASPPAPAIRSAAPRTARVVRRAGSGAGAGR